jgi:biopolymer transport protein ExbB
MDAFYGMVSFFVSGGAFMYPILLVFAVGTAIAIERYITLSRITSRNASSWSAVQPLLNNGEFDEKGNSSQGRVLRVEF